ncbi:DUF2971 domain-containing protein [Anaerosalibacter sp. Marseille-P3206]|uniref:DUF2971 domain-containing protein n=1 Tax=Anaerosalibacter sp. Marseille-P3206 TaxID=1871005 RepID=UPI0013563BFA|nr:DUF2971 domain-containing protein [Anaerosalibacter sp. Marseille-P3206]
MEDLKQIKEKLMDIYRGGEIQKNLENKNDQRDIIYYYTNVFALKNILENETLWFSSGKYMNDSTDLNYSIGLIREISDEILANERQKSCENGLEMYEKDVFLKEKVELLIEKIDNKLNNVFLLSTSKSPDSLTLWANYSTHDGYNIGMEKPKVKSMIEGTERFSIFCYDVIYDQKRQNEIIREYISILYNDLRPKYLLEKDEYAREYINGEILESIADQLSIYSIFIKNPSFKQEEEYRIALVNLDERDIRDILKFRISNGVFIPYIEIKFNNSEDNEVRLLPLKEVTIGPKNSLDIAEYGLKNMFEMANYNINEIAINKSSIPLRY